ncbi:MAG: hypothetical protein ACWA42_08850 [Lutibacter sp.]
MDVKKIDTIIDFNSVDAFPLFPECQSIPSREKQQICFQIQMSSSIYALLNKHTIKLKPVEKDTLYVKLKVDTLGITTLLSVKAKKMTSKNLAKIDSLLRLSLKKLPKLSPAIKRDMPVTTQFTLPIIFKKN